MKVYLKWSDGKDEKTFSDNHESVIWKWIASHLSSISIPNNLSIELRDGSKKREGVLELIKRGNVKHSDGTSSPSLFVRESEDCSCDFWDMLTPSSYDDAYLVCINPSGNNYKFYWLKPDNTDHVLNAQYGRLGSQPGERFGVKNLQTPYPSYMYWIRYYEKLSKGYKDMSDAYLNDNVDPSTKEKVETVKEQKTKTVLVENPASIELYKMLLNFAQHYVNENLAEPRSISWGQIEASKKLYTELCNIVNAINCKNGTALQLDLFVDDQVNDFNDVLEKLMMVSPRRVDLVSESLANDESDFTRILDREDSLINAMLAVKTGQKAKKKQDEQGWKQFNIDVHSPTNDERKHIMSLVDSSMRSKVKMIFMIEPNHQRDVFNKYCVEKNINVTKELFHGSGLENWFSITENSLLLPQHNHARKTGQALGMGLYFGNNSIKSSHYAHNGINQMLGVFDVAYGKPFRVLDTDHNCYFNHDQAELDNKGCNCLHYHRQNVNWADEIVVYSERAVCLKALILLGY